MEDDEELDGAWKELDQAEKAAMELSELAILMDGGDADGDGDDGDGDD